ncbi:hypothetical protein NQ315_000012 [Exocentrus adspersus]|uniref:Major facilitator superfamily (MFS) profile domain-containing protein n=1 Tax=Exocentrus adspersus TaxID=1586481 RepID=A0AAV8VFT9_9CUCU|nr:hypothetical protein NQ315_000012 [Exocentrus adspersus]
MDLDEILISIGEFGTYQKFVIWFVLLPAVLPCGFHAYNQLFMAVVPDHWCSIPELNGMDVYAARNLSIPLEKSLDGQLRFSNCYMYDFNYTDETNDIRQEAEIIPCKFGWIFDIDDISKSVVTEFYYHLKLAPKIIRILFQWNLVCNRRFSVTLSLMLLGASGLIGNYIFGYIQDTKGRKLAFFIYLLIQCVFGMATAFAHNYYVWTACRIGVGFTVPAILGTPYVLAIELVGSKKRTTVTILINIAYSVSLILLSVVVWAIPKWRLMAVATTLPFFALFFHWWLLPESPRWLLSQGKFKEAERILRKIARTNGKHVSKDFISSYYKDINNVTNKEKQEKYGIMDLFSSKNMRWKTMMITFLWFTNTSVYVGLSYYAPALQGDEYLNFFLAGTVELPTYLFLWPAIEKLGRRWTLCLSMIIGGTSCLTTFWVEKDYFVTLTLYCIGKMGISSSFVVLPLIASELYPTVVRGLGMSFSSVIGMIGPILIPLVNYLGTHMLTLPLIIMGFMLIIGGVCSLLLPETRHLNLPQTLKDAEHTKLKCFTCYKPPKGNCNNKTIYESQM